MAVVAVLADSSPSPVAVEIRDQVEALDWELFDCDSVEQTLAVIRTGPGSGVVVVFAASLEAPLVAARRVYQQSPMAQLVFLSDATSDGLRAALESPVARIGSRWSVIAAGSDLSSRISAACDAAAQAAQLRTTIDRINLQMAGQPKPDISDLTRYSVSDRFLAHLLANARDAVIAATNDGSIISWNPAAATLFGRDAGDVMGTPIADATGGDWPREFPGLVTRLRGGETSALAQTLVCRRPGGEPIDIDLVVSLVRDVSGGVIGISAIARDVTEERRLRQQVEQAERLDSLGVLAAGVAHNFNNILTGIIGNAGLALELTDASDPRYELLDAISGGGIRAADLVRQMLAFSGKRGAFRETFDPNELVATVTAGVGAGTAGCTLLVDATPGLPPIHADRAQLRQVVAELVNNAIEAIDGGEGSITISTSAGDGSLASRTDGVVGTGLPPGRFIIIDVTDTGPGMDGETLARIFDPFFSTRFAGRGLGLAAVRGTIRSHGGDVHVSSTPGEGTTFRVLLPAAV
jgi:PAS domain S-box-containing protein